MKKIITNIVLLSILANFFVNISFAEKFQLSTDDPKSINDNLSIAKTTHINKIQNGAQRTNTLKSKTENQDIKDPPSEPKKETLREKSIKKMKQKNEQTNNTFLKEIQKFENMTEKDYVWYATKSWAKSIAKWLFICAGFVGYTIFVGYITYVDWELQNWDYLQGLEQGYNKGLSEGEREGRAMINKQCKSNEFYSSTKKFLNNFIKKFHPDVIKKIKSFDNIKKLYQEAEDIRSTYF